MKIKHYGWILVFSLIGIGLFMTLNNALIVNNIDSISRTWQSFESNRSEKSRTLNAFRSEIGYGGMIHNLKNYILRRKPEYEKLVVHKIDNAIFLLDHYDSLVINEKEKEAIQTLRTMLSNYRHATIVATSLIKAGAHINQIDRIIKVDDTPALDALTLLDTEIHAARDSLDEMFSKPYLVASIRKAMGYGGIIHDFKNQIIRNKDNTAIIKTRIETIKKNIKEYKKYNLSAQEKQALVNINNTLFKYNAALNTVEHLKTQNLSPERIDKIVKIDDRDSLNGFKILGREITRQNEVKASDVSRRIKLIGQLSLTVLVFTICIFLILIFISLWAIRKKIITPIESMTKIMTRLAANDLDIQVHSIDKQNEIGDMARAILVFKENVVQRKKIASDLKHEKERYRIVIDSAPNGIITLNSSGNIEMVNVAVKNMFMRNASALMGKSIDTIILEKDKKGNANILKRFIESKGQLKINETPEVEAQRRNNQIFTAELGISTTFLQGKRIYTVIIQDITQRKKAELMKNEFVSTVSHELRTPLTSIKGSLGLIQGGITGAVPEKIKPMIKIAYDNCDRLIRLINDILDIEKISAGKIKFKMESIDLNDVIKKSVQDNLAFAKSHKSNIVVHSQVKKATVLADSDRLNQVLTNLISNAVKFSPEYSNVDIVLQKNNNQYRVSVVDKGSGIPKNFYDEIFTKFSQVDSSDTRLKGGTGLGLSICKSIIDHHNGEIAFVSEINKGSEFYFDLPVDSATKQSIQDVPVDPIDQNTHRVLICEDEPDIAKLLEMMLVQAGFQVDLAYTAQQAKEKLLGNHYDAMTLDLALPDENGIDVLKFIQENEVIKDLPVIIISQSKDDIEVNLKNKHHKIVDWIQKPIDESRLIASLHEFIHNHENKKQTILHIEDDPDVTQIIKSLLGNSARIITAKSVSRAKELLKNNDLSLIILDQILPDGLGTDLLPLIHSKHHEVPVIVFSAIDELPELLKGVQKILIKSKTSNDQLLETIQKAIHLK